MCISRPLLFSLFLFGFGHFIADADTTPPVLNSLSVTPTEVDVSNGDQAVTFRASISDEGSGFDWMWISYSSPSGEQTVGLQEDFELINGNSQNGTYEETATISQFAENGIWKIESIELEDANFNGTYLYGNEAISFARNAGFSDSFSVQGALNDTTPPQIVSFEGSAELTQEGNVINDILMTIRVEIRDSQSGYQWGWLKFTSPRGNFSFNFYPDDDNRISGDANHGVYEGTVLVPYSDLSYGSWTINEIQLFDSKNNILNRENREAVMYMVDLGMPISFSPYNTSAGARHTRSFYVDNDFFFEESRSDVSKQSSKAPLNRAFSSLAGGIAQTTVSMVDATITAGSTGPRDGGSETGGFLVDRLFFHNSSADETTLTRIPFQVYFRGDLIENTPDNVGNRAWGSFLLTLGYQIADQGVGFNNSTDSAIYSSEPSLYEGYIEFSGSFAYTTIYMSLGSNSSPINGYISGEAKFTFGDFPDGVSYQSESGYFLNDSIQADPPKNLIVLTHGFQPGTPVNFFGSSRLPSIRAALEDRLESEGIRDDTEIIEFSWLEAFEDLSIGGYLRSRAATQIAGDRLAVEIETFIKRFEELTGVPYEPNIHIIGHSLGTMVNAQAASVLTSTDRLSILKHPLAIEQFTIIDSPLDPAGILAFDEDNSPLFEPFTLFEHEQFFWEMLDTPNVLYVENFYAENWVSNPPRFGQPIAGAGPCANDSGQCGGLLIPDTNHETILDFYANLVSGDANTKDPNGNGWNSPVLGNRHYRFPWDVDAAKRSRDQELAYKILSVLSAAWIGNVIDLDLGRFLMSTAATPEEPLQVPFADSSSAQGFLASTPDATDQDAVLETTYQIPPSGLFIEAIVETQAGAGQLTATAGSETLLNYQFTQDSNKSQKVLLIPVGKYQGQELTITWTLSKQDGNIDAELIILSIRIGELSNYQLNYNPEDTDNDGLVDEWELSTTTDLLSLGEKDSDGDALTDFVEMGIGTNPTANDAGTFLQITPKNESMGLKFFRPKDAEGTLVDFRRYGLRSQIQVSNDLVSWHTLSIEDLADINILSDDGLRQEYEIMLQPELNGDAAFSRFRVVTDE